MDRDEEMGHGDRSLLFIGDEDDDLAVDRDGAYSSSSDGGDDGDGRDAPDEDDDESQQGEWPQSYRQSVDMRSVVPSPTMSSMSRFSSNLIKNGSSFFLKKGDTSLLPLTRPLLAPSQQSQPQLPPSPLSQQSQPQLPPSLSQLSQLLPPAVRESTDSSQPQSTLSQHGSGITERPSRVCLKSDYIELPPPANKCSMGQAIINGLNILCGVGVLTTPFAIKEGGWLGLLLLPLLGACSFYTGLLLKRCMDSSQNVETYPDIGRAAFGTFGRIFVAVVLYLELYASCVEFITLLGDSLSSVFPSVHLAFTGINLNSHTLFAITMALLILPSVWLKNLSLLSYLSAGGVFATLTVIMCLFWVGIGGGIGFHPSGIALNLTHLPVALGLYGYCYSGHSVFPNIYSSMKDRSQFPYVLVLCFIVCTSVYAGVAVTGFMMFGESTMSQFTLNMPQQLIPSKIAIWMTIVNPYTKYALTMTPVALSIEEALPKRMQNYLMGMSIRTCLVISTVVVSLTFPYFALVMALLGSVFTMLVALILPCACYLSIKKNAVPLWEKCLCVTIIMIGIICACVGSYTSIHQMISSR